MDLPTLAARQLDQHVADEAGADAVGDAEGKRHHQHRQDHRHGVIQVAEIDSLAPARCSLREHADHQHADHDQRRGGRHRRDRPDQSDKGEGEQEEHPGHHRDEPGAPPAATPAADSM